jgi:RNA polymerase sigma-70 factor, ECF subfamily
LKFHILAPAITRSEEKKGAKNSGTGRRMGENSEIRMENAAGEVTALLFQMKDGRQDALDRLIPLVYRELRRLAGYYMRDERASHTLQATALVHEAFLRLVDQSRADWQNRAQFMGVAAQLMRRLLVDHARRRSAAKRGSPVTLDEERFNQGADIGQTEEILAVDEVLARLQDLDPQQARVVEMRYFGGLSVEETAEAMGISARTVKRDWAMAKAWLKTQLAPGSRHDT